MPSYVSRWGSSTRRSVTLTGLGSRSSPRTSSTSEVARVTTASKPSRASEVSSSSLPSLFCFMVFVSGGYEMGLVKAQRERGISVFSCDDFALVSDEKTRLDSKLESYPIGPMVAKMSTWGSWSNTAIFVRAWQMIISKGTWRHHDWTVKVDPDCVFFAYRLRAHLEKLPQNESLYLKNWRREFGFLGPVEVFSRAAIETFHRGNVSCQETIGVDNTGEDGFMQSCMEFLQVGHADDFNLLDHSGTMWSCGNAEVVAFHPFKTTDGYLQCLQAAATTTATTTSKPALRARSDSDEDDGVAGFCCTSAQDQENFCGTCWAGAMLRQDNYCGLSKLRCESCDHTWCNGTAGLLTVVMRKDAASPALSATLPPLTLMAVFGSLVAAAALMGVVAAGRRSAARARAEGGGARLLARYADQADSPPASGARASTGADAEPMLRAASAEAPDEESLEV
mmetsp:Transcript_34557/g.72373  ORF Transcript_34557/g.72373 Transcript_34557/m.72373 type:complete len:452 (-) Transcript_34557:55-1410(-)